MNGILKIVTQDAYLGQKLRLELLSVYQSIEITDSTSGTADVWLYDTRTHMPEKDMDSVFYLAEDTGAFVPERTLPLPLPIGLATSMLGQKKVRPLLLTEDGRTIRFYGTEIRLTEVEYALLRVLREANGAFISRERLHAAVWGNEGTESLLNVYIHYLREKLEKGGEKVILSSRKYGYALAEKFTGGEKEC